MLKQQKKNNIEGGLYMPRLCDIQYGELYIDRISAAYRWELQRTILTRLSAIMKLCADILDGKAKTIGMKGE